jgi:2-hydroxy-6-oxonona-2,4-dienedioate hydrolase
LIRHVFQYLKVDNLYIRYRDIPSTGNPILLIHGLGGSIDSWINNIDLLSSEQLRLIAIDLPGFGFSSKPKINYTINFYTTFIAKFIKELKLSSSLSIIGFSLGGHIAAEVAINHSRLLSKLILVSPAGTLPISFRTTPALKDYVNILKAKSVQEIKKALSVIDNNPVDDTYARIIYKRLSTVNAKEAFLSALKGSRNAARLTIRLHKIKANTLLIWGKDDQIVPVKYSIPFIRMENCRMVLLEKCGHRPHIEKPKLFNKIVAGFVKE